MKSLNYPRFIGVLAMLIEKATPGTTAINLCEMGDNMILEETGKVYKKEKELKKGLWNIVKSKITLM